jgi:hypothetical protein
MSEMILEQNEADICVFIIEASPLMYFGELYYDADDTEKNKLVFKKALLKVLDAKANTSKWIKVPTSGKDSLVVLDTRIMRGVLVKNIDPDEITEYKDASLKLYSKLTLV